MEPVSKSHPDAEACTSSPDKNKVWTNDRTASIEIGMEDEKMQCMTGSYSEIVDKPWESIDQDSVQSRDAKSDRPKEEEEGDLLTPICENYNPSQSFMVEDRINAFMRLNIAAESEQNRQSVVGVTDGDNSEAANFHEQLILRSSDCEPDSDFFSFVSQEWLDKMSLNMSNAKKTPGSSSSSCIAIPNLLRSTLQPTVPLVDPAILHDIEAHARNIATSMDNLIENLTGTLHSISSLTVDCVETYSVAVCKTCDAVDSNIKSMYQLMAKCEELSKSMAPMYKLHDQIKEIRRLLDLFESIVFSTAS